MTTVWMVATFLAWFGVGVVALLAAMWEEPVLGFIPILAAVIAAWVLSEYTTRRVWMTEESDA